MSYLGALQKINESSHVASGDAYLVTPGVSIHSSSVGRENPLAGHTAPGIMSSETGSFFVEPTDYASENSAFLTPEWMRALLGASDNATSCFAAGQPVSETTSFMPVPTTRAFLKSIGNVTSDTATASPSTKRSLTETSSFAGDDALGYGQMSSVRICDLYGHSRNSLFFSVVAKICTCSRNSVVMIRRTLRYACGVHICNKTLVLEGYRTSQRSA